MQIKSFAVPHAHFPSARARGTCNWCRDHLEGICPGPAAAHRLPASGSSCELMKIEKGGVVMHGLGLFPARLPDDSGNSGIPQDLGKGNLSHRHHQPLPFSSIRGQDLGLGTILPGHSFVFLFLLERDVKLWLVYLDTERLREVGNVEEGGQVWGYGDGPGRETQVMDCQGAKRRSGKAKKERETGAKGPTCKCTNMQMYKKGISTSLGVLSREA